MNMVKKTVISFCMLVSLNITVQAALFDTKVDGVYGGFFRDLYAFGPVVVDTIGGDLGIYANDDLKIGFSFATVVGLLSNDAGDDVFDGLSGSSGIPDSYGALSALEPADFSYSTAALKVEYILYEGDIFGWSSTLNLGQGVYGQGVIDNNYTSFSHTFASLGTAVIIKFTEELRMSLGISYRSDFNKNDASRPAGFGNLDAITVYNHFYVSRF